MCADCSGETGRAVERRRFLTRTVQAVGLAAGGVTVLRAAETLGIREKTLDISGARLIAGTPAPHIVTRAEWGADESRRQGTPTFADLSKIIVHHTATQNNDPDPALRMRAIYSDHLGNGWNDIAYHFVISPDGRIWEGRWARDYAPGEPHSGENTAGQVVIGAHALNHNTGTMGIALLGTFISTAPSGAALESLVKLLAWVCDRHGIDPMNSGPYTDGDGVTAVLRNICGHRDVRATSCPGDQFYNALEDVRVRTALTIANGFVGYRILSADGGVANFGGARHYGDVRALGIQTRVSGAAGVPNSQGYIVVDRGGSVFSFGGAGFFGSIPGLRGAGHNIGSAPIIGIAATNSGQGYWLYDDVGGMFAFGDARYFGSVPGLRNAGIAVGPARIATMAPTPSGNGYWVLDEYGGVFAFGDAQFFGSLPALREAGVRIGPGRIVSLAPTPSGNGYWVLDEFGGIFAFGDAQFFGSLPSIGIRDWPARRIIAAPGGNGYVILTKSGAVYAFGAAPFYGRWAAPGLDAIDLAPVIRR